MFYLPIQVLVAVKFSLGLLCQTDRVLLELHETALNFVSLNKLALLLFLHLVVNYHVIRNNIRPVLLLKEIRYDYMRQAKDIMFCGSFLSLIYNKLH